MVGTLNFFLDPEVPCTWRQASILASKAAGRSKKYARTIRGWLVQYLTANKLPLHGYGYPRHTLLNDEDIAERLQEHLLQLSKDSFFSAADVVKFMKTPEMQEKTRGRSISERTARRWLRKLDWRYKKRTNGMYIDGHERPDVVAYREKFVGRWKRYELRMVAYDNDGDVASTPKGFEVEPGPFRLILVTHDESTFYENDRRKFVWGHSSQKNQPVKKGEGQSIMVSDFLTLEWGRLKHEDK
ncbi:uncharacterized protein PHACADRAFT_109276 [Phanerochaete carnosa HHB-10118-sp]|uniref:Uncharacterized protein n=1 Tax=Phanerochaete carnosa (strain HHB-10118-sp) TaxID=650164 RepID=K5WDF9_PHACS|nr:uncharacterized protein PHACADRAFT_109276 [Phanerochaete carnosa HHB-10118-sp]EKM48212.1 hypothetical protein PHACADRAFT_109276 [Phanerochaete carnosa HHB-10118-sp]